MPAQSDTLMMRAAGGVSDKLFPHAWHFLSEKKKKKRKKREGRQQVYRKGSGAITTHQVGGGVQGVNMLPGPKKTNRKKINGLYMPREERKRHNAML